MVTFLMGKGWLAALALALDPCEQSLEIPDAVLAGLSPSQDRQGRDLEQVLYTRLRRDGVLNYPKMNYELIVKRVEGRKLLDTEFRRKDPKTGLYDLVARAREAELKVQIASKQVLVQMHHCSIASTNP